MSNAPQILVIDDEPQIQRAIRTILTEKGFGVATASRGEEGLALAAANEPDIIILDLGLPDMDGVEVCARLREWTQCPIIILSVRDSERDKVAALDAGADDYLTKPFNKGELIARIRAIVRRSKGHAGSIIQVGNLSINFDTHTSTIDGKAVHLTSKEQSVLELLALRKGTVLSKEVFLNHLYNGMDEPELKIIDVFICKMRKKLYDISGGIQYVETIWGRGYVLKDPKDIEENKGKFKNQVANG